MNSNLDQWKISGLLSKNDGKDAKEGKVRDIWVSVNVPIRSITGSPGREGERQITRKGVIISEQSTAENFSKLPKDIRSESQEAL